MVLWAETWLMRVVMVSSKLGSFIVGGWGVGNS